MQDTLDRARKTSHTANLVEMDSDEFSAWLDERWEFLTELKQFVKQQVSYGKIEPVEGGRVIACGTGQILGYQEFHAASGPDLLASLSAGLGRQ